MGGPDTWPVRDGLHAACYVPAYSNMESASFLYPHPRCRRPHAGPTAPYAQRPAPSSHAGAAPTAAAAAGSLWHAPAPRRRLPRKHDAAAPGRRAGGLRRFPPWDDDDADSSRHARTPRDAGASGNARSAGDARAAGRLPYAPGFPPSARVPSAAQHADAAWVCAAPRGAGVPNARAAAAAATWEVDIGTIVIRALCVCPLSRGHPTLRAAARSCATGMYTGSPAMEFAIHEVDQLAASGRRLRPRNSIANEL